MICQGSFYLAINFDCSNNYWGWGGGGQAQHCPLKFPSTGYSNIGQIIRGKQRNKQNHALLSKFTNLFCSKSRELMTSVDLPGSLLLLGFCSWLLPYCWFSFFLVALSAALDASYSCGETKCSVRWAWTVLGPIALRYPLLGRVGIRGGMSWTTVRRETWSQECSLLDYVLTPSVHGGGGVI